MRIRFTSRRALLVALLATFAGQGAPAGKDYFVYFGTYTATVSKGIHAYRFQPSTGKVTPIGVVAEAPNPSWFVISPNGKFLYAVNWRGSGNVPGDTISAFRIDRHTAQLTFLNKVSSRGQQPTHLAIDSSGKTVMVANYGTGTFASFPVAEDGRIGEGVSVDQHIKERPDQTARVHAVLIAPDNRFVLAAEVGLDRIYSYHLNAAAHTFTPNDPPYVAMTPNSGPRHLTFHPNGKFVYSVNSRNSTVSVFAYNAANGTLMELESVPTFPKDFKGTNSASEVQIDREGRFLYVSNRGHNSIAVFAVDAATGKLNPVEHVSTQGKDPRNFSLDPTGGYLFAGNENSSNVALYRVDHKTGRLKPTGQILDVPSPSFVTFLEAQ